MKEYTWDTGTLIKQILMSLIPLDLGLVIQILKYSDLQVTKTNDKIDLSVEIENTGSLKGKEIVHRKICEIL